VSGRLALRAGRALLELAPGIGGSVARFLHDGAPVFRLPRGTEDTPRALAAYPLFPWSNRVAGGRFAFAGREYHLERHGQPHALHGVGWRRPWQVIRAGDAAATIRLTHAPDADWPFAFVAEQHYELSDARLVCRLLMRNTGEVPAPAAFGLHPYFPRPAGTRLTFRARSVWLNDADMVPRTRAALPPGWDHAAGPVIGDLALDNCFNGWDGAARLDFGGYGVSIEADACFGHLVVFVPTADDFCAVEPVTNMNDGLNRMGTEPDHGMAVLAPGETLEGAIRFNVFRG
jgi:aldose 1-epimerase